MRGQAPLIAGLPPPLTPAAIVSASSVAVAISPSLHVDRPLAAWWPGSWVWSTCVRLDYGLDGHMFLHDGRPDLPDLDLEVPSACEPAIAAFVQQAPRGTLGSWRFGRSQ